MHLPSLTLSWPCVGDEAGQGPVDGHGAAGDLLLAESGAGAEPRAGEARVARGHAHARHPALRQALQRHRQLRVGHGPEGGARDGQGLQLAHEGLPAQRAHERHRAAQDHRRRPERLRPPQARPQLQVPAAAHPQAHRGHQQGLDRSAPQGAFYNYIFIQQKKQVFPYFPKFFNNNLFCGRSKVFVRCISHLLLSIENK